MCYRPLYRDSDFNVESFFLSEVEHANSQMAIYPSQIRKMYFTEIGW